MKSPITLLLALLTSISFAQSAPPTDNLYKPKLGSKSLAASDVNYTGVFPINGRFDGKLISYLPYYAYNGKYEGRKYLLTDQGTTIEMKVKKTISSVVGSKDCNVTLEPDSRFSEIDKYNTDASIRLSQIFGQKLDSKTICFYMYGYNNSIGGLVKYQFYLPTSFEYKVNGNIETFEVQSYQGGNRVFCLTAYSKYHKAIYVFVGTVDTSEEDKSCATLTKLNESQIKLPKDGIYNLNDCTVHSLFQDEYGFNYLFLEFSDKVVPVKCFTIDGKDWNIRNTKDGATMNLGTYWETPDKEWSGSIVPVFDLHRVSIDGLVNYYSDNTNINAEVFKLIYYNNNFDMQWSKTLNGIKITQVYSMGNYIVIGGYTKSQGYVGFPNPRIMVINKTTQDITYDKVITMKNAKVKNITSDYYHNVEITLAIWSENKNYYEKFQLTPTVILDKLNKAGTFDNDLFQKD